MGYFCGDLVFSRALELDWDYAWVVEPDLYFINGSEKILGRLVSQSHDLIGTHIWKADEGWYWHRPLSGLGFGFPIHAMAFPLVRMSRFFSEDVCSFRREILHRLAAGQLCPNDESIVSTLAHENAVGILDLHALMGEVFRYWGTTIRYNVDDIASREDGPLIVHSGQGATDFDVFIDGQLEMLRLGDAAAEKQILQSVRAASLETAVGVLRKALRIIKG